MKRSILSWFLIATIMISLTACGSTSQPKEPEQSNVAQTPAQSIIVEEKPQIQPAEKESIPQETVPEETPVTVTFTPMDHSVYNETGNGKAELIYDLATLSGGDPTAIALINQYLQDQYRHYQEEIPDLGVEDLLSFLGEGTCYYTISGHVSYQDQELLSIFYGTDWMMGGVHNYIPFGYTFSLSTGHLLTLDALFSTDPASLLAHIKDRIRQYLVNNGLYGTAMDSQMQENTLENYQLDTLGYYIAENAELVICIPVYELASGAAGSFTIPCGVYLGSDLSTETPPVVNDIQLANFIGKPVSDLLAYYGGTYIQNNYAGSTYLQFEHSPLFLLGFVPDTLSNDMLIRQIIATDRYVLLDNIESYVTYPELVQMVGDAVMLGEPEYYYNQMDDFDAYTLSFQYQNYHFVYTWYDDPSSSPALDVGIYHLDVPTTYASVNETTP